MNVHPSQYFLIFVLNDLPQYHAVRDGSHLAVPEKYVPADYEAPRFNVRGTDKE